ncbi:MAG TPA: CerR family C-terminal domain-containing protein [Terriglobales bacterium]|jgi:TetR/AcrR family transcriptional regulator
MRSGTQTRAPKQTSRKSAGTKQRQSEATRTAILSAALDVFSREGAMGARTEEIAAAAGVNKAMLYYYFEDKEALHGAVLEHAMSQGVPRVLAAIEAADGPRAQLAAYLSAHFDVIAGRPRLARLMQHEMMRAEASAHLKLIAERFTRPLSMRIQKILEDGIETGEFRALDARHATMSIVSTITGYFLSASMLRLLSGIDPYAPEALAARKAAVIDFVMHAVEQGSQTAESTGATTVQKKGTKR